MGLRETIASAREEVEFACAETLDSNVVAEDTRETLLGLLDEAVSALNDALYVLR